MKKRTNSDAEMNTSLPIPILEPADPQEKAK